MPGYQRRLSRRTVGLSILVCVFILAIAITLYRYFSAPIVPPPLKHTTQSVNFPLYYPTDLPAGYAFGNDSLSSTSNVVLFSLQNTTTGDVISISEQPTPSSKLNLNAFYHNQFDSFSAIATPIGNGVYGKDSQNATISIPSDKTWLIIRAPLTSGSQIKAIALKLAKLH